jgi:hypothetical protein
VTITAFAGIDKEISQDASAWTPRAELRSWISWKLRSLIVEIKLLVVAKLAVCWGDTTDCNLALDAILKHMEDQSLCR